MLEIAYLKIPQIRFEESNLFSELHYLDKDEREKFNRFKADSRKFEFLIGRMIVKNYISEKFKIPIKEIRFLKNQYGKLYIDYSKIQIQSPKIYFNISHTKKMVAVAFCHHSSIGIDIEFLNPEYIHLGASIFTTEEKSLIEEMENEKDKVEMFYTLWTRKEASLKALGKGFSLSPLTISLPALYQDYEDEKIKINSWCLEKEYIFSLVLIKELKEKITVYMSEINYAHLFDYKNRYTK